MLIIKSFTQVKLKRSKKCEHSKGWAELKIVLIEQRIWNCKSNCNWKCNLYLKNRK